MSFFEKYISNELSKRLFDKLMKISNNKFSKPMDILIFLHTNEDDKVEIERMLDSGITDIDLIRKTALKIRLSYGQKEIEMWNKVDSRLPKYGEHTKVNYKKEVLKVIEQLKSEGEDTSIIKNIVFEDQLNGLVKYKSLDFIKSIDPEKLEFESRLTNNEILNFYTKDELGKQLYKYLKDILEDKEYYIYVLSILGNNKEAKLSFLKLLKDDKIDFDNAEEEAKNIMEDYHTPFGLKLAKVVERLPKYDKNNPQDFREEMKNIIEKLKSEGEDMSLVDKYFDKYCDIREITNLKEKGLI